MKKLLFLLTIFLFTIYGCQEDVTLPTVVSGNAYAVPASIKAGESTTIVIENLVGVVKATANNIDIPINTGSRSFTLTSTTTFNVTFYGTDKVIEKTVTVNVAPVYVPTKLDTMLNLFINKPWKLSDVSDYTIDGKLIVKWTLSNFDKSDIYYFYEDYSRAVDRRVRGNDFARTAPNDWSFTQNFTHICFNGKTENEFKIILSASEYKRVIPNYKIEANGNKTPIYTIETYNL